MKNSMTILIAVSLAALLLVAFASACGGAEESIEMERIAPMPAAPAPAPAAMSAQDSASAGQAQMVKVVEVPGETVIVEKEVVREVELARPRPTPSRRASRYGRQSPVG